MHLRQSMMADTNTTFECQVQFPELRAMRTEQNNLCSKSLETRGLLDALCKVLIDAVVVSEQRLLAEAHRRSFAAVRRSHPCDWDMSLWRVFQSREVAYNVASCLVNKRDSAGLRIASKAFATCMAEVISAWARPKVLVWGSDGLAQDSVEIFDPVFNTWETSPSAYEFREEAASAVINGRLYVCGGDSGDRGSPSTSLDCFDPVLGIWQVLPPMSQGRERHSAAVVGARLCVCGGQGVALRDGRLRTLGSAEVFDTVTNTWQSLPAMVHPRRWAGAAVIRGHVYMVGGLLSCTSSERLPHTGNWQELPPMNEARMHFSTAVIADRLYVCGGIGRTSLKGEEAFDVGVHAQVCLHLTLVHDTTTATTQHYISSTARADALTMMSFWTIMAHWLVLLGTHRTLLPVCMEEGCGWLTDTTFVDAHCVILDMTVERMVPPSHQPHDSSCTQHL